MQLNRREFDFNPPILTYEALFIAPPAHPLLHKNAEDSMNRTRVLRVNSKESLSKELLKMT